MGNPRVAPDVEFSGKFNARNAEEAKQIYRREFDCEIVDFKTYRRATPKSPGVYGIWYRPKCDERAYDLGLEPKQLRLMEKEVDSTAVDSYDDARGKIIMFENNEEWLIYDNYEIAESSCIDYVKDQLETEPEIFNQEWLRQYIKLSDTDRRMLADDLVGEYPSDIRNEDDGSRLAEEAGMSEEFDEIQEKIDEYEDKGKDTTKLEEKKELLLDNAEEKVRENMYDDYYERLEDPFRCLVEEDGIYSAEDFYEHYGYSIDIDEAAEDAVNTDGVAHFFASYDGNEVELDDGTVIYRVN